MDLRDYARLIRRGWLLLVVVTLVSLSAAALYLLAAPKQYSASATILVTINDPSNIAEAQQGISSSMSAATTYAGVIDSAVVIAPATESIRPLVPLADAVRMVTATARENSALIDVTVLGSNPQSVVSLANGTAKSALTVIPALQGQSASASPVSLKTIQNATLPTSAVSPDTKQVLALGLVFGLVLGLALTIASQTLNTRLRRPEDVQNAGPIVLAALPRIPRAQRQGVVVADHPNSSVVEAYRTLRTNLGNLEAVERRSVLITPVTDDRYPAEVSVNIAWSLGQGGRSVLLVDLDLRRAPITELLQLTGGVGLADLLESPLSDHVSAVRASRHPRVHVVTSGTPHQSPSDILSLPKLGELIRAWEARFDYVILNAPSVLSYTDAAVVARETGATLITVHAGKTRAQGLAAVLGTLESVQVQPMGVVLTGTRVGATRDNRRIRGEGLPAHERTRVAQSSAAPETSAHGASDNIAGSRRP